MEPEITDDHSAAAIASRAVGKSEIRGLVIAGLSAVVLGLYPPAAKVAYADGANSVCIILVTTFFRAASLVIFCIATGRTLVTTGEPLLRIFSGGFFQAISIIGVLGSLAYLPGPVALIILFSHTIMLLLFLAYLGQATLTPVAVASTLAALLGLSFVVDVWSNLSGLNLIGISLAFMSAIATMSRLYVFGVQLQGSDPAAVGARTFVGAFVCILGILLYQLPIPPHSAAGYLWLAAASMSLIVGTFGTFYSIALVGAFRFSMMIKIEPIFTALFSIIILGEVLKLTQYLGMALVVGSLMYYQYSLQQERRR